MKLFKRRFLRINKFARTLFIILILGYIVSFALFCKSIISLSGIETIIRYTILILCVVYFLLYVIISLRKMFRKRYGMFYLLSFITLIIIIIFSVSFFFIDLIYDKLSSINEKDKINYTSYLINLKDNSFTSESIIGMINDKGDIEGNKLAKEIIKDNKLKQEIKNYDDYLSMLYDLYENKVDAIFVSGNYVTLYSSEEDFANIALDTKILYEKSKEYKNKDKKIITDKSLTEPFTALIMGVDSEINGLNANAAFNGDTLILATFNPKTFNATLLSIPRDTYVPISCRKGAYAKINSSAAYGTECVIKTIEDLTNIKIDYYVKINFKGVVELVDAVGGVEVDVQEPDYNINHGFNCNGVVCEQDSSRRWGEHTIYIDPGHQLLNGEEALAYARCRGLYADSDFARNRHQQDIITSLANNMIHVKSYSEFKNILEAISSNISTNMSTSQILSSYNILKEMIGNIIKDNEFINIQKSYLETYSLPVYLPNSGRTTSALGYYKDSLTDIIDNMKVNLEIKEAKLEKSFSFSIDENYEAKVAGKGIRTGSTNSVLASFIGKSKEDAKSYCEENDLECEFVYIDDNSSYYDENIDIDLISYQSPNPSTLMRNVTSVTFYINGATKNEKDDE